MEYDVLVCDEPTPETGRVYKVGEVRAAVEKAQAMVAKRTLFVVPSSPDGSIDLNSVKGVATRLWLDGSVLKAEVAWLHPVPDSTKVRLACIGNVDWNNDRQVVTNLEITGLLFT